MGPHPIGIRYVHHIQFLYNQNMNRNNFNPLIKNYELVLLITLVFGFRIVNYERATAHGISQMLVITSRCRWSRLCYWWKRRSWGYTDVC